MPMLSKGYQHLQAFDLSSRPLEGWEQGDMGGRLDRMAALKAIAHFLFQSRNLSLNREWWQECEKE